MQAAFLADNEEEDFNDVDSQATGTVSDCVFSDNEEVVDVTSGEKPSSCYHDLDIDIDEAIGLT